MYDDNSRPVDTNTVVGSVEESEMWPFKKSEKPIEDHKSPLKVKCPECNQAPGTRCLDRVTSEKNGTKSFVSIDKPHDVRIEAFKAVVPKKETPKRVVKEAPKETTVEAKIRITLDVKYESGTFGHKKDVLKHRDIVYRKMENAIGIGLLGDHVDGWELDVKEVIEEPPANKVWAIYLQGHHGQEHRHIADQLTVNDKFFCASMGTLMSENRGKVVVMKHRLANEHYEIPSLREFERVLPTMAKLEKRYE